MNISRLVVLIFACISHFNGYSQYSDAIIIDNTLGSAGVSKITTADLNQNGKQDIIASFTGTAGKIGYYTNLGNGIFSPINIIDTFPLCRGICIGDFNEDGWIDIAAIGGSFIQYKIYYNNSGTFTFGGIFDSNLATQPNDIVAADFDGNNSVDIVAICQHAIDFYRNDSNGNFTKEEILTTSTSSKVLECLDIEINDVDGDGDIDLICGETAGLVVYFNDGNGIFSPQYFSIITEIISNVHLLDVDNDNDLDVITRNSGGEIKWFSNPGDGFMNYEGTIDVNITNLIDLNSIDYNNDGRMDIYASYNGHISLFLNDSTHNFDTEIPLIVNNNLPMGKISTANLDNQNQNDLIWSGGTNTIAIHLSQTLALSIDNTHSLNEFVFPNPTSNLVFLNQTIESAQLYRITGEEIASFSNISSIDLQSLHTGIYILRFPDPKTGSFRSYRILKN